MQVEIKMVLGDASDYQRLTSMLAPNFIAEESYRDFFFDFPYEALTEQDSVLRLRVPCTKVESSASPTHVLPIGPASGATGGVNISYEAFLNSCAAPPPPFSNEEGGSVEFSRPGKLTFKQRNMVENGHHLAFAQKEDNVPPEVVARLISGEDNPFDVLAAYAESVPAGGPVSKILERLQCVAQQYQTPSGADAGCAYTAASQGGCGGGASQEEEERNALKTLPCKLVSKGSYSSVRKVYRYIQGSAADIGTDLRERLRLRVDRTLFPFGEKYELEVPNVDEPLDDVMKELKTLLTKMGINYQLGSESKYARFINGMRARDAQSQEVQDVKLRLTSRSGYEEVLKNLEAIVNAAAIQRQNQRLGTNASVDRRDPTDEPSAVVEDAGGEGIDAPLYEEEAHENFFFDGPDMELRAQNCFLRLRRFNSRDNYQLVLKERQTFRGGRQESQTSKMDLSQDVALALLQRPETFLAIYHEQNAVAGTLWHHFGLRTLSSCAFFRTHRLTVPWWSAQSQRPTVGHQIDGAGTQHASVSEALLLSQQQRSATAPVPPLVLHLDRSQYEIPVTSTRTPASSQFSAPILVNFETGHRVFEMYELEVSSIAPSSSPGEVMKELTMVLDGMGVEWASGTQSKLEQYYHLMKAMSA